MNIFKRNNVKKSITTNNNGDELYINGSLFTPINFDTWLAYNTEAVLLSDFYGKVPEIQIPVNYIVDNVANLPLRHVKVLANNKVVDVANSKVLNVIKKPNQFQTTHAQFIKQYILQRVVNGIVFVNKIVPAGSNSATPTQLYILDSARTKAKFQTIDDNTSTASLDPRLWTVKKYVTDMGYGNITLTPNSVNYDAEASLRSFHQLNYKSRSRVGSAISAISELKYNYEASLKLYRDRGALGIISPKDAMSLIDKDYANDLKRKFYDNNGVTGNKNPFLVNSVPLEYTPVSFNAKDLLLNESKKTNFITICNIVGVAPSIFLESITYENKKYAALTTLDTTIRSYADAMCETLTNTFNLEAVNEKLIIDYDNVPLLQEYKLQHANTYALLYDKGIITMDEFRAAVGIVAVNA